MFREFALIDDFIDHEIAFKVVNECITEDLAFFIRNIHIGTQNVAEYAGHPVILDALRALQQTVDFSRFFQ